MKTEPVSVNDARELLDIYAYYVKETAVSFEYEVPLLNEFEERIYNISAKYPYIKAVDDNGLILGYAYAGCFKNRAAYDWSVETTVYVRKDMRRKGIGRMLYNELEKLLRNMGILNMNACIAVTDNEDEYLKNDSVFFHEKMGFKTVGTFHKSGYKFDRWYDMIWMEKMTGEHSSPQKSVQFGDWK